jgi:hypothetical protein
LFNRQIKLWSNEDGRCIEHIRTNLKHRAVQVNEIFFSFFIFFSFLSQCFNYQLTNENFLICCGCYSEIVLYDMRTLEIKYTLTPSHVDAEWISTFFIFQKTNAPGLFKENYKK